MAVCWVILRGQLIYTVIQAVHSLLYIVAKCHFFSVVTCKDIIKYLKTCEGWTHFCEILYFNYSECLFALSANSPPWWQRLFILTPPTNVWDWAGQHYNRLSAVVSCGGADGKMCVALIMTQTICVQIRLPIRLWQTFFPPFSNFKSHQNSICFQ